MKTRENDQKNSKEKEKFPTAGVPDRKVTALSIDGFHCDVVKL